MHVGVISHIGLLPVDTNTTGPAGSRYRVGGDGQTRCTASWVFMARILYRFLMTSARRVVRSDRWKDREIIVPRPRLAAFGPRQILRLKR